MQGDAVEHLDLGTTLDDQPFHHVEAVQLPLFRGDLGQMPTRWRRGATCAFLAVQGPPAFEDAVDGPHRGERLDLAGLEGLVDRLRPMEAQVAALSQLRSYGQDQVLDGGFGSRGRVWGAGVIVPVHSVESLALGTTDPGMNSGLTDAEFVGDLVLRSTAPDGGDDGPTASGFPIPLLMRSSREGCGFQSRLHLIDRYVVAQK